MYFKACLDVKTRYRNKNRIDERVMYIQARDIINAMDITKKIRGSSFKIITPISYEEYMKGVSLKYTKAKKIEA